MEKANTKPAGDPKVALAGTRRRKNHREIEPKGTSVTLDPSMLTAERKVWEG